MPVTGPDVIALQVRNAEIAAGCYHTRLGGGPDDLIAAEAPILMPPIDGPYRRTFTFTDPVGYAVTVPDQA